MLDIKTLENELNEALKHFLENSNNTVNRFSNDDNLKQLARYVSEDTFRCLSEFEQAILKALNE